MASVTPFKNRSLASLSTKGTREGFNYLVMDAIQSALYESVRAVGAPPLFPPLPLPLPRLPEPR